MKKLILSAVACLCCLYSISQSPRILVPFRMGSKWGYSDTLGKIKIQPRYDTVSLFDYDRGGNHVIANVRLRRKPMVINETGTVIVPPNYDHIQLINQMDDFAFYVSRNGKFGVYINGKELFPPVYDYMDWVPGVQFKVHRNGKWGLINSEGKLVIPVIYDELRETGNRQNGMVNWEGDNYGSSKRDLYTIKEGPGDESPQAFFGNVQLSESMHVSREDLVKAFESMKEELELDSVQFKSSTGIVYKDSKQGALLPGEVKKVYFFSKQYNIHHIKYFATDSRNNWNKNAAAYIIADLNGKYGMMTETEKEVLPFEYDNIEVRHEFSQDEFFLLTKNRKVGFFIWNTVHPVIQPAYDGYISKGFIRANNNWNFTLFRVEKNGKQGFVGENGIAFFRD
jgi:hypothetical protein